MPYAHVNGFDLYYETGGQGAPVVFVHGGPSSARRPAWPGTHFDPSVLSSEGYFVFFPNPRGSYGQGEKFTRANVRDFGHGDLRGVGGGQRKLVIRDRIPRQTLRMHIRCPATLAGRPHV